MTLVLSEVSKFGLVMVGDSAIESTYTDLALLPSGKKPNPIVRTGCDKVKQVPGRPIGISFWGMGKIGDIPTDLWVDDYIQNIVEPDWGFDEICEQLKENVNYHMTQSKAFGRGGFHVGTVKKPNGGPPIPYLYHVHNDSDGQDWEHFRVQEDIPKGLEMTIDQYLAELNRGMWRFLRNGFVDSFQKIQDRMFDLIEEFARTKGIMIPSPENIQTHEKFARLQVGLMADLFALSNHNPLVGRPITSLTIDMEQNVTFTSSLSDITHL